MGNNSASPQMIERVLQLIPQQAPFRFIDGIRELDIETITGYYHYKKNESFYQGHFPGNPITPGVILIETMAQATVVAQGIYLYLLENPNLDRTSLFVECDVEFFEQVRPDTTVITYGKKVYFRRGKIKAEARLELEDGTVVASGTLSGIGVKV